MAAAVIKLNSLPDAVRPGAKDHDLATIGGLRLVLFFVSRVEIRRVRFELRATRVDAFVNRNDAESLAIVSHFVFGALSQISETPVRQSDFLEGTQLFRTDVFQCATLDVALDVHHLLQLIEKPRVDLRQALNLRD